MAGVLQEWSSNANDAVRISIVQPDASGMKPLSTFHPKFTYPIFGEEEHIFGYQNLDIHLRFAAHDLRPNLEISYDKKFQAVGGTSALDLNKTLKEWIPKSSFQKTADFEKSLKNANSQDYRPPGKLIHSYTRKGRKFEVWAGSMSDKDIKEMLDRIQVLVSFFIEGGTPLNTEDVDWTIERWTVYFVYEHLEVPADSSLSPYSFVGYATTYRFYSFAPTSKGADKSIISNAPFPQTDPKPVSELPSRLRISQFVILPPHQHMGHGSELYNAIFDIALADSTVQELTVEDPNEEFDLIRDVNDYTRLLPELISANISINPEPFAGTQKRPPKRLPTASLLPMSTLQTLRHKYKVAPRQFARITEMYLLSKVPKHCRALSGANMMKYKTHKWRVPNVDEKTYYWWRMLLKQRIYKKNKDTLIQLDVDDRYQKLDETVLMQEGEYELILAGMEDRKKKIAELEEHSSAETKGSVAVVGSAARKRKLVVEDDEDEDGDDEEPADVSDAKRAKT